MSSFLLVESRGARRRGARPTRLRQRQVIPSLRWWRRRNFVQAARNGVAELRGALSLTMWPGRSDWRVAARGDAATAIRLGLAVLAAASPSAWTIDLAGSALLLCVAEGNPVAGLVLSRLRRRFVAPKPSSRHGEA